MELHFDRAGARAKRDIRVAAWLAPKDAQGNPVQFRSTEAEQSYRDGIARFMDAVTLEKVPDRVPILAFGTFMPTDVYGVTPREALYDYDKLYSTYERFLEEYRPDYYGSPAIIGAGRIFDRLDLKLYRWPGHGVSDNSVYQCVEGEYMLADEYQALIDDPSGFWLRTYLPRVFGALAPLSGLTPLPFMWEIAGYSGGVIPFGVPPIQEALRALMDAGSEALKWVKYAVEFDQKAQSSGFATIIGGIAKAPYDILADTLRGTQGIMVDLYRQPDMVIKAMARLLPLYVQQGVSMATMANNPVVFLPLHKGADGFMSDQQFKTFYWPTLKALLIALINEGCIPMLFCEGSYDTRLEYLKELPAGTCFSIFDRTDMVRAKALLGERMCIGGNVPAGLLLTGTVEEVKACCKNLIDRVGVGGGYVMCNGTAMDQGNAENLHAMIDFSREYGVYRQ